MIAHSSPARPRPFRVGPRPVAITAARVRPDRYALFVIALMAPLTISTPAVELFGVPRITAVSLACTLYMLVRIRGKLNRDLQCFVFAYVIAFVPSTIDAALSGELRISSLAQGAVGLITFMTVGTYFFNWLAFTNAAKIATGFRLLTIFFIGLSVTEIIFFKYFVDIRLALYQNSKALADFGSLLTRELTVYGGRPSGLFSEPSHFARFIGLMMAAYIAVTQRSAISLWASGAFLLATRSISFFFGFPVMLIELNRAITIANETGARKKKGPIGLRLVGAAAVVALALGGIYYTQSERIEAGLGGGASAAATGDNSLNERIVFPAGYFIDGPKPLLFGLGPTPQEEMQEYTLFATRSAYHSRLSADYQSAISATIFTLVGMGYVGVVILILIMFQLRGWFGIGMIAAYFASNIFSSGYHSATSLVPSGLLLGIMSYQRFQRQKSSQLRRHQTMHSLHADKYR